MVKGKRGPDVGPHISKKSVPTKNKTRKIVKTEAAFKLEYAKEVLLLVLSGRIEFFR